jgi:simple sugar transport system ATP-binding protein
MAYALELKNITKIFGNLIANDSIALAVEKGSVHAIVGENGAGKSTLMNIVTAIHKPNVGEIYLHGNRVEFKNPMDATRYGVGMVHQEFMLFRDFTVWENIITGFEERWLGVFVSKQKNRERIEEICKNYNFDIPLDSVVNNLPVAMLQQVEIVKTLYRGADIIILDEPTAVLTPQGVDGLFEAVRSLKEMGKTIIFISHKLREVFRIADRISVMRGGRLVNSVLPCEINEQQLANMMVGNEVILKAQKLPCNPREVQLSIKNLNMTDSKGVKRLKEVSLEVRAGEIVGIAGVAGSGQQQLIEAIIGLHTPDAGSYIELFRNDISGASVRERRCMGMSYVPQDRMSEGVNAAGDVWENAIMGYYIVKGFSSKVWLKRREINEFTKEVIDNYSVKVQNLNNNIRSLSGGNIQKLIVGREFSQDSRLLIVADPSRGIDVGAIEFIWKKIIEFAASGVGVLLISHDLNEVMELSDRIMVMYNGTMQPAGVHGELSEYDLGYIMMGGNLDADDQKNQPV